MTITPTDETIENAVEAMVDHLKFAGDAGVPFTALTDIAMDIDDDGPHDHYIAFELYENVWWAVGINEFAHDAFGEFHRRYRDQTEPHLTSSRNTHCRMDCKRNAHKGIRVGIAASSVTIMTPRREDTTTMTATSTDPIAEISRQTATTPDNGLYHKVPSSATAPGKVLRPPSAMGLDPRGLKPLPRAPRSTLERATDHANAVVDDLLSEREPIAYTAALAALASAQAMICDHQAALLNAIAAARMSPP